MLQGGSRSVSLFTHRDSFLNPLSRRGSSQGCHKNRAKDYLVIMHRLLKVEGVEQQRRVN